MGAALAHHAASLGMSTTLIEATVIGGGGATAHSRGIVRVYDPNPNLMQWSMLGVSEWANWSLAMPSPFVACGLTYFVAPANRERAIVALSRHDHAAYPINVFTSLSPTFPGEFKHLWNPLGLVLHEPAAGYVDTRLAARLFAQSARQLGASIVEGSTVVGLDEGPDSARVRLAYVDLHARHVVLATGASTPSLTANANLFSRSIPLSCVLQPKDREIRSCVIDELSGGYARPDGADFFYCGGAPQQDAAMPDLLSCDMHTTGQHNLKIARRISGQSSLDLLDTRLGYDAYTSDFLPRLDICPGFNRIRLAAGFSGRGAKYIPAVARKMANEIERMRGTA